MISLSIQNFLEYVSTMENMTEVSDPRPAVKIVSLLFAIVLVGSFGMAILKT